MNRLKIFALLIVLLMGGFFLYQRESHLFFERFQLYYENGNLTTLKPRFTTEQILNNARPELIQENTAKIKAPVTKMLPLLLLEVKYKGEDDRPKEGYWIWNSFQGELILNLNPLEMTHGFRDAINSRASLDEFRLIKALAVKGSLNKDLLKRQLGLNQNFESLLQTAQKKQLILVQGQNVKLHLQSPKIETPSSIALPSFVLLPYEHSQIISHPFSKSEVAFALESAFGPNLKIRSIKEIFMPILEIDVEKKDGSHVLYHFNSVTGETLPNTFWN